MNPQLSPPRGDWEDVGPDRLIRHAQGVVIYAAREMPDWQVREFCKIPVFVDGRKFFLLQKHRLDPPHAMAYELAPWPADLHEESTFHITYDAAYVAQRDRELRDDRRDEWIRWCLLPLYPFLGFLWSRFKDDVLERYGFHPRSLTSASLMLSLGVFLVEGIFVLYFHTGWLGTVVSPALGWLDYGLFLLLPFDGGIRFNQVMNGVEAPDGFLEWLLRPFRAPPPDAPTSA